MRYLVNVSGVYAVWQWDAMGCHPILLCSVGNSSDSMRLGFVLREMIGDCTRQIVDEKMQMLGRLQLHLAD